MGLASQVWVVAFAIIAGASGAVFSMFGVEPAVVQIASICPWIVLLVNTPLGWELVISSGVRGAGDVRTPLLIGIAMNVFYMIGDYALIFARLGAPATALGTSGSMAAVRMGPFVFGLGRACIALYGFGGSLLADRGVEAALLCARFRRGRWKTLATRGTLRTEESRVPALRLERGRDKLGPRSRLEAGS